MKENLYKTSQELSKEAVTLMAKLGWYLVLQTPEKKQEAIKQAQAVQLLAVAILKLLNEKGE